MTSRELIICLLASMVMRNPLLLKMRHISFLMFSVSLGVALVIAIVSVKSYVYIKILELGEEKAPHEFTCFGAVVASHCYVESPDEWATTKQACRDELVVYVFSSSVYIYIYIYIYIYRMNWKSNGVVTSQYEILTDPF